jgi:hypothetical protein
METNSLDRDIRASGRFDARAARRRALRARLFTEPAEAEEAAEAAAPPDFLRELFKRDAEKRASRRPGGSTTPSSSGTGITRGGFMRTRSCVAVSTRCTSGWKSSPQASDDPGV